MTLKNKILIVKLIVAILFIAATLINIYVLPLLVISIFYLSTLDCLFQIQKIQDCPENIKKLIRLEYFLQPIFYILILILTIISINFQISEVNKNYTIPVIIIGVISIFINIKRTQLTKIYLNKKLIYIIIK